MKKKLKMENMELNKFIVIWAGFLLLRQYGLLTANIRVYIVLYDIQSSEVKWL